MLTLKNGRPLQYFARRTIKKTLWKLARLDCTCIAAVNGQPSGTYEQTMAIISGSSRPISITFVMPNGGGGGGRLSGVGGGPPVVQQSWVRLFGGLESLAMFQVFSLMYVFYLRFLFVTGLPLST